MYPMRRLTRSGRKRSGADLHAMPPDIDDLPIDTVKSPLMVVNRSMIDAMAKADAMVEADAMAKADAIERADAFMLKKAAKDAKDAAVLEAQARSLSYNSSNPYKGSTLTQFQIDAIEKMSFEELRSCCKKMVSALDGNKLLTQHVVEHAMDVAGSFESLEKDGYLRYEPTMDWRRLPQPLREGLKCNGFKMNL